MALTIPATRVRLLSSVSPGLFKMADSRLNSPALSSRETRTIPLSACNTALLFSLIVMAQAFMWGNNVVSSTFLLLAISEIAPFCSSSFLLSITTASIISEEKALTTRFTIGSFVPESPTPLSSEDNSFFIQSSGLCDFVSWGVAVTSVLYLANRSLPSCKACSLMFPFRAISAR